MTRRARGGHGGGARRHRGTVHPLLDLHGETADEACRRAEAWLRGRQAEGHRTVLVVTGRGVHSRGAPVLRGELRRLPPPRPGPRPPSPASHDPALRRRAEEALWELGVTPSPELLEATIRRLLRDPGTDGGA